MGVKDWWMGLACHLAPPTFMFFILPAWVVGTNWDVAANRLRESGSLFFFFFTFLCQRSRDVGPVSYKMSAHTIMFLTMGIWGTNMLQSRLRFSSLCPNSNQISLLKFPLPVVYIKPATLWKTWLGQQQFADLFPLAITLIGHFTDIHSIINSRAVSGL